MGRRQLVRITEPLAMDPLRPALLGLLAWSAALVALLLVDVGPDRQWWVWTAAAGVAIGLLGSLAARRARAQLVRTSSASARGSVSSS